MVDEVMAEQENTEPDEPTEEVESEIDESLPEEDDIGWPDDIAETFVPIGDEDGEPEPDDDDNPFD